MSIEQAYNSWADIYDSNQNKTRDLDAKATVETLSKYDFKNVIELGAGTGKNTSFLLSKAEQVVSLDFSEEMLNKAKVKIKDERVSFRRTDLNKEWDAEDDFADLVTASLCLEHIENLNQIFAKANTKLKKKGLFFISELHPFKQYLGTKARYETEEGVKELEVYTHHLSEFIHSAQINGFTLKEVEEWFDGEAENEVPRIISLVFQK
ncbi:class I SAM-dependent methyltransferase [Flammeovirga sp. EKP202]|uniref:class I SAM-dependent DNA methyltransferase n=1 Tax=Flammeovirga sp. EKP202 TaxID=2770592 RepID=UPI00165FBAFA|nr:class I SAM-dependent methyltransferase [Flammeovirga sp. EKP202]MBD0401582.1 class I SAM-dependent methyltransferase [Flammeovirga sp. EKP202]